MYTITTIEKHFFLFKYCGDSWPTSSNIYVIPDADGLNIIDSGLNKENCFSGFRSCLNQLGFEVSDVHTVILTHGHTDHIAGTHMINQHSSPRIFLSEKSIPEAIDPAMQEHYCLPSSVRDISVRLKNYAILENFENTCGRWRLNREGILPIRDGDQLEVGDYTLRTIHVPGHDIGLMVFYEPNLKLLLTTDLMKSSGPGTALPWYSSSAGGPGSYLRSLDQVEKLDVEAAFPSHGAFNGSLADAISRTRADIIKREAKIIASLKNSPKTCDQLDGILFRPIVLELCPWYSSVTESHLLELEENGVVMREDLEYVAVG